MAKVTIYRFEVYDPTTDDMLRSRRWGTREAIENFAHGHVLTDTAIEVDEDLVRSQIPGLTQKGFDPRQPKL